MPRPNTSGKFPELRAKLIMGDMEVWAAARSVLPATTYRWFECYFTEGMSQSEITLFYGCGKTYVSSRITHGLLQINLHLAKKGEPSNG
jgi:hypothetical protein